MSDLSICPICEAQNTLSKRGYVNVAKGVPGERVLCATCGNIWHSEEQFEAEMVRFRAHQNEASPICQVCTGEVVHRQDSPWNELERAPHVCQTCQVCPSCGTRHFKSEDGKVKCLVCGAAWERADDYEFEIRALVKILGLEDGQDPKERLW